MGAEALVIEMSGKVASKPINPRLVLREFTRAYSQKIRPTLMSKHVPTQEISQVCGEECTAEEAFNGGYGALFEAYRDSLRILMRGGVRIPLGLMFSEEERAKGLLKAVDDRVSFIRKRLNDESHLYH